MSCSCVAPNCDNPLIFRVTYGKKKGLRGFFKKIRDPIEIELGYNAVVDEIKDLAESEMLRSDKILD